MIAHKTPETKVVIKNFQKICGLLGAPGSSPSLTFSGFVLVIFIGKEIKKLLDDKMYLKGVLKKGSEKASKIAEENLKNIREKVGLI